MRRIALLFAALALAACASSHRITTYNIRLNLASDGVNAWPNRSGAVAAVVAGSDIFGVQEALPDQLTDLDTLLPRFARFGEGRTAERRGEHTAIFYRLGRYEVLENDTFWLSPTPDAAGSKGWDAAYERIATWGKLRDRRSGVVFYIFNTHFDHVGVEARRESAVLLLSAMNRVAGTLPVILTGDFNDVATSPPYQIFAAGGFRDAREASRSSPRGPDSTWNAFREIEPGRRIDFIFVRGPIEVLEHVTRDDRLPDGRFASDHLPVSAVLRIR